MPGSVLSRRARALARFGAAVTVSAALIAAGLSLVTGAPAESSPSPRQVLQPDPVIEPVPDAERPLLVVPDGAPVRERVIVALHGYTADPQQLRERLQTDRWVSELDATVVLPTGLGERESWNAGGCCGSAARSDIDDVGFLARAITRLRAEGAAQVFLVGYSNGGMLAYRVACERPDLVDGIAVINATVTTASCDGDFEALHLAGEIDPAVPVQGADVIPYLFTGFRPLADLPDIAPNAQLDVRVLPGVGHEIAPEVPGLVTEWLRQRM